MRFFMEEHRRKRASVEHWGIVKALKKGDNQLLASRCGEHISKSKDDYARSVLHPPADLEKHGGRSQRR
jgi:DNA-binding GntR family transcriptional regulator